LVLYEGKDGKLNGVICNDGMTSKDANWIAAQFIAWLCHPMRSED